MCCLAQAAYKFARKRELYDKDCYMASNESEYWAEGTQSWFDATVRCGVCPAPSRRVVQTCFVFCSCSAEVRRYHQSLLFVADVNTGVCTRELLKQRDPRLAKILTRVYGDGTWRYPQTAPAQWPAPERPWRPSRRARRRRPFGAEHPQKL